VLQSQLCNGIDCLLPLLLLLLLLLSHRVVRGPALLRCTTGGMAG
jgi:hypothetical protein